MRKKLILTMFLIVISISLTGCWDSIELNQREIVTAVGFDKGENEGEIEITYQSIIPENISTPLKSSTSLKAVHVVTLKGYSANEALVHYNQVSSKIPYFNHNRVFLIGEDIARKGINSFTDVIFRSTEHRSRAWVLVCKGRAEDILKKDTEITKITADYIVNLINSSNNIATVPVDTLHSFMKKLSNKNISPVTAKVEILTSSNRGEIHRDIGISGSAVFYKDKLMGWLNMDETRGLLWINNDFKHGAIISGYPNSTNRNVTEKVTSYKTKIRPKMVDGKVTISLDIKQEGMIGESDGKINLDSTDNINILEKALEEEVKKEVEACLKKVQKEYKSDVLGFGEKIHQRFPKEWKKISKDWDNIFPNVNVETNVKVKLRSTGKIFNNIKP